MQAQQSEHFEPMDIEPKNQCNPNVCTVCNTYALSFEDWILQNPSYLSDDEYGALSPEGKEAFEDAHIMTKMDYCCNHPICNKCMNAVFFAKTELLIENECPFCGQWLSDQSKQADGLYKFQLEELQYCQEDGNNQTQPCCTGCNFLLRGTYAQRLDFKTNQIVSQINHCIFTEEKTPLFLEWKPLVNLMRKTNIFKDNHYESDFKAMREFIRNFLHKKCIVPQHFTSPYFSYPRWGKWVNKNSKSFKKYRTNWRNMGILRSSSTRWRNIGRRIGNKWQVYKFKPTLGKIFEEQEEEEEEGQNIKQQNNKKLPSAKRTRFV